MSPLVAVLMGRAEAGAVDAVHLGRGVVVDVFAMEAAAHAAGLAVEEDPIDGEENDLSGTAAPLFGRHFVEEAVGIDVARQEF